MTRYFHATPKSNFNSIVQKGIIAYFEGVYCSTSEETAARWVCFKRRDAEQIMVLPFDRPEGDERMTIGIDHSPMMTQLLGVSDEGASFVSSESIPMTDIDWEAVMVYDNPFYQPELAQEMEEQLKKLREEQRARLNRGEEE